MSFVDYYEVLEISPNANSETIERVFRYLAQRYHPDNPDTGDRSRFELVLDANNTLKDPAKRARYDLEHRDHARLRLQLIEEAGDREGIDHDVLIQNRLLSLFYVKCRKNIRDPGIGDAELSDLLDCPPEHLDFHLWYLKEKRWISRREDGLLAITIDGVDRASSQVQPLTANRLLTENG
ncbi:DnaJ domain-containing protein [Caulobacter sp. KR2-114]|uniref:DnaJ domain-containing protein n=1 Tax=Caulobacter sp. KR2-114 TaxID=3400912 RepID=UPI003C123C7B